MQYETVTTNDGTHIAFQTSLSISPKDKSSTSTSANVSLHDDSGRSNLSQIEPAQTNTLASRCILLMHGFSGSSEYFVHNYDFLTQRAWVVAPDMRGHGRSQHTRGGYHVARLAADLHDLLKCIQSIRPDVQIFSVGCSIGAAVLWTYIELYGNKHFLYPSSSSSSSLSAKVFQGMVFVDQAPLQDRTAFDDWDQTKAHFGLYDEKTLMEAQAAWSHIDTEVRQQAHKGLVASCLGYRAFPTSNNQVSTEQAAKDETFFTEISARCDGVWLARLMADHTRYDHREAIETIDVPVLVMAGGQSGCFPLEGMLETVKRVNTTNASTQARASVFDCGHWLFYERPERFNRELWAFIEGS